MVHAGGIAVDCTCGFQEAKDTYELVITIAGQFMKDHPEADTILWTRGPSLDESGIEVT